MKVRRLAALVSIAFLAASCGAKDKKPAAPSGLPVTAGVVEKKDVPLEAVAVGHVDAFSTVAVRTRVGGEVTSVGFREGQDVKQGDLLFEIDRRPYQAALAEAEANLERDRARAREADENLKRYAELVKKDYVTQEQFSQAKANADALKATVKADDAAVETARLNVSYCRIAAPISGRTGGLLVHSGNMIKANDDRALVVINQVEPIYVTFALPEAVLADVKKRAAAGVLKVSALPNGPGLTPSEGTLSLHRQHGGHDDRHDQPEGHVSEPRPRALARTVHERLAHARNRNERRRRAHAGGPGRATGLVRVRHQAGRHGRGPDRRRAPHLAAVVRDREGALSGRAGRDRRTASSRARGEGRDQDRRRTRSAAPAEKIVT